MTTFTNETPLTQNGAMRAALRNIDAAIADFRALYPPPYLDRSRSGISWQALNDCRNIIAAQLGEGERQP